MGLSFAITAIGTMTAMPIAATAGPHQRAAARASGEESRNKEVDSGEPDYGAERA